MRECFLVFDGVWRCFRWFLGMFWQLSDRLGLSKFVSFSIAFLLSTGHKGRFGSFL